MCVLNPLSIFYMENYKDFFTGITYFDSIYIVIQLCMKKTHKYNPEHNRLFFCLIASKLVKRLKKEEF